MMTDHPKVDLTCVAESNVSPATFFIKAVKTSAIRENSQHRPLLGEGREILPLDHVKPQDWVHRSNPQPHRKEALRSLIKGLLHITTSPQGSSHRRDRPLNPG